MVRVDLHLHSSASFDCRVEPERVASRCRSMGLSPIFLTDHDTIAGAVRLTAAGAGRVIVGEEVMTTEGELIGLFLEAAVPGGLSAREAASEIRAQGGLVYLEHPYDLSRRHLSESAIESLADVIDIVEVFNGRSDDNANRRGEDLCEILGAAPGAGSDAHTLREIGAVYTEMEDFSDAQDFLAKLRRARIVRRPSRAWLWARARFGGLAAR